MPRDPTRIDPVIEYIRAYWKRNSDLRLMQIFGNVFPNDAYYVEDDELIKELKRYDSRSRSAPRSEET